MSIWRYVGVDESNHGFNRQSDIPEIYVAVSAQSREETELRNLPKFRDDIDFIEETNNDYSFLLFSRADKLTIPKSKKLGIVLGSLLAHEQVREALDMYVDGLWNEWDKNFAIEVLADVTAMPKDTIKIKDGTDLDRRIKIVNYADIRAYWLFSRKSLEDLTENPYRKELLRKYVR